MNGDATRFKGIKMIGEDYLKHLYYNAADIHPCATVTIKGLSLESAREAEMAPDPDVGYFSRDGRSDHHSSSFVYAIQSCLWATWRISPPIE